MTLTKELIYDYERVLLGKKKEVSPHFFVGETAREKRIFELFEYVVKTYLEWDADKASVCLTREHLDMLKLSHLLGYLEYPPEIDEKEDFFYILNKMYPDKVILDFRELAINVYQKVLDGRLPRFPKGFFDLGRGELRAIYCLEYAINQELFFSSPREGYEFFASPKGNAFVSKMKIKSPMLMNFNTPLDFYHKSLGDEEKSELWYRYHKFNRDINKILPKTKEPQ
jgi:hypothetical protein